ncbi:MULTISPECIES: NACHT domain-containing protein [unclassified Saccharothrix]|uniref:NACHT domain-containing protein n=1 Tax=unclassified Saccharothrix TaxID=2593673 RepID=UPI00307E169A
MSGLEAAAGRAAATVGKKLFEGTRHRVRVAQVRDRSRAVTAAAVADAFVLELTSAEAQALAHYLTSPDFEEIAHQMALWRLLNDQRPDEIGPTLREEIRLGLRHAMPHLDAAVLTTGADLTFDALTIAVESEVRDKTKAAVDPVTAATVGHLAAAAVNNTRLLSRVGSVAKLHRFADRLRGLIAKMHSDMRMPHLGISRSVPYSKLYVEPSLQGLEELALAGRRTVVLGDPGAGKSTLVAKLAYEIASAQDGRVPFLLTLRDHTDSFREGGQELTRYLKKLCSEPYNLPPPKDAVEYLLGNGRAVVLLDGVDELVDPELRRRFAKLIEGFARLHPSVPLIVTARKIGYDDAPLAHDLFTTRTIEEFADGQVAEYAVKWFALDDSTPESERSPLAESFLAESEAIAELRANPLLLALLCAMYSSERYIPTNLAQVYEKCAILLFDRWDRQRGLQTATQFRGRLRSAVGFLAWKQLTAGNSGAAWGRGRIVVVLTRYLMDKGFDPDDAADNAEDFVTFCTGRPWILTDTGSDGVESLYGFTHRTFMEYFAAEHLVRTNDTTEELWNALHHFMQRRRSEIVCQLALQLYEQRKDEGASDLLRMALSADDDAARSFAATALGFVQPVPDVTAAITRRTVAAAVVGRHRVFGYYSSLTPAAGPDWQDLVNPVYDLFDDSLPENLPTIRRAARAVLDRAVAAQEGTTAELVRWDLRADLPGDPVRRPEPWATILYGRGPLADVVREFGPRVLYEVAPPSTSFAERMLLEDEPELDVGVLLDAELPWLPHGPWHDDPPDRLDYQLSVGPLTPLRLLLLLPYLEVQHDVHTVLPVEVARLVEARHSRRPVRLSLPPEVGEFIDRWALQEFHVTANPRTVQLTIRSGGA